MSAWGGLSGGAAFSLTLTAAGPVGAVWLCSYYEEWGWRALAAAGGLVLLLLGLCGALLRASGKRLQIQHLTLTSVASRDSDIVGFLIAYAMPLLAGPPSYQLAPLVAFAVFLILALWRTQIVHVNPLASLLGYHFFKATAESGVEYLLVSRRWNVTPGDVAAVRLSRSLWLELPAEQNARTSG